MIQTTRFTRGEVAALMRRIQGPSTGPSSLPGLPPLRATSGAELDQAVDELVQGLFPHSERVGAASADAEVVPNRRVARGTGQTHREPVRAYPSRGRRRDGWRPRTADLRVDTIAEVAPPRARTDRATGGAGLTAGATILAGFVAMAALANLFWAMSPASEVLALVAAPAVGLFAMGVLSFFLKSKLARILLSPLLALVGGLAFAVTLVTVVAAGSGVDVAAVFDHLASAGLEAHHMVGELLSSILTVSITASWALVTALAVATIFVGVTMVTRPRPQRC